jgi:hypothetical protein
LFAVVAAAGLAAPSRADLVIIITDGVHTIWADANIPFASAPAPMAFWGVQVGGVPFPSPPTLVPGEITGSAVIGNFTTTVHTVMGFPILPASGATNQSELDLNATITATGPGTLTVTAFQTGLLAGGGPATLSASIGGTTHPTGGTGSATAESWFDQSNTGDSLIVPLFGLPAGVVASFQPGPFSTGTVASGTTDAFSASHADSTSVSGAFALISQTTFTFNGTGSASYNFDTLITTPAPSSVVIAAWGIVGVLGFCAWKRRKALLAMCGASLS